MKIDINQIKKIRQETQAPMMEIKKALEESGGDEAAAKKILNERALVRAKKKKEKKAGDGYIFSYIHSGGRVGVLLELRSETDFVAKNDLFQNLGRELTLQVASMGPKDVKELLEQDYIRDQARKISDLVDEVAGTVGEKIEIARFIRYEI